MNFDLTTFNLPYGFENPNFNSGAVSSTLTNEYGINLQTDPRRWENWVVKLQFMRLNKKKYGNGFYVNVPNKNFDLILTAGHNLTEAPMTFCRDIRILGVGDIRDILVTPGMIHVCQQYLEEPSELNQIYDYGAIVLPRDNSRKSSMGFGFGFNLMLGLEPVVNGRDGAMAEDILLGKTISVSGYRPGDNPKVAGTFPRRPGGDCLSVDGDQLWYTADMVEGISGGPVWLGFRGVETVVGIHNYAEAVLGEGHRGCRLNLNIWADVFQWMGLGWSGKYLSFGASPSYSMHLHIGAPPNNVPSFARVRVGKPGIVETRFTVLPVSSRPNDHYRDACYGYLYCNTTSGASKTSGLSAEEVAAVKAAPQTWWLRWDAQKRMVMLARQFDGMCEVKLLNLVDSPNDPFGIQVRLNSKTWMQLSLGMELLGSSDLKCLDKNSQRVEDTSEVSFKRASTKGNLFKHEN